MLQTSITFIGAAAVLPGPEQDTACFLINGRCLFDTGWYAVLKMQQYGYDPLAIEHLIFTHFHHDHYMGLPGLMFFRGMRSRQGAACSPLKILGPPADLSLVVERSRAFLQAERFEGVFGEAELLPLPPGDTYETGAFRLETAPARHPVEGMIGRFTDRRSGVVIAFSGDTGIHPGMAAMARGADLLIHEASLPPEADESRATDHSRAADAARVAANAGVRRLKLVHLHGNHADRSLAAARAIFPETELAGEGETLRLSAP
jgi:ribonuclease Z